MPRIDPDKLIIRVMGEEDVDAIVDIDARILGQRRPVYYERKCALALDDARQLVTSLIAEQDDEVIGFIMGNVYLGEFGIPETTASLDTIGIHPDYQGQGLAIKLMKEFVTNLKKAGVERIYTLVNWNDWDLLRFFEKSGFVPAKMLNLELQIHRGCWLMTHKPGGPAALPVGPRFLLSLEAGWASPGCEKVADFPLLCLPHNLPFQGCLITIGR
jgi:predicted N-acetyltransferase YhbS